MKSLKKFKKMIIEGRQSPLQDENVPPVDLKIPEIRQSAYKIIHKHRQETSNQSLRQHSLLRKDPLKIPSRTISPLRTQTPEMQNTTNTLQNIQNELNKSDPSKLVIELTQQELEYLEKVISVEKQVHEEKLKEGGNLLKLQEKVSGLRRKYASNQEKKEEISYDHKHRSSENQTEVLSVPSSFQDFNKTLTSESSSGDEKQPKNQKSSTTSQGSIYDPSALQFRKIMYILQSKTRAVESRTGEIIKFNPPITNNYRLFEQANIQSISFRADQKNSQKKIELYQIVTMLNTKYKKNIQFN